MLEPFKPHRPAHHEASSYPAASPRDIWAGTLIAVLVGVLIASGQAGELLAVVRDLALAWLAR